ncbi:MAG: ParB N-terminal domain-containing protein [Treponema sp.]|nr:ParB N-terminal domain-containing protein [Treponema sp.]
MLVPIEEIKVKKRIRKEMGDISALAESLKKFGQISPIVITKSNVLVAGERRLEAAKSLGWASINVIIADIPDELTRVEYEREENTQRLSFTDEETLEAEKRIERLSRPCLCKRIWNAIVGFFRKIFKRSAEE